MYCRKVGIMKKLQFFILTLVFVSLSLVGFTANVFAYDSSATVSLTRGGSSKWVDSDYKDAAGEWKACISSASVIGLPPGVYGNTLITTRMYTADLATKASNILTLPLSLCPMDFTQNYNSGYGAPGAMYWLKTSMSSSSSTSGCTINILFSA